MSSPSSVRFCPQCEKPFSVQQSFKRHVSYCRRSQRRPRKRSRSCFSCNQAKTKCDFALPCRRCIGKDIQCTYSEKANVIEVHDLPHTRFEDVSNTEALAYLDTFWEDAGDHQIESLIRTADLDQFNVEELGLLPSFDSSSKVIVSSVPEVSIDGLLSSEHTTIIPNVGNLTYLPKRSCPVAQHNAIMVMQALRSFPERMLDRKTFPFFIHPQHHLDLPEPLAVCMRISHMFASRTPGILPFIWRTIMAEQTRSHDDPNISSQNLQATCQAHLIYLIMIVMEGMSQPREWIQQMLVLYSGMCTRAFECHGEVAGESTWEMWIIAESRRRIACVYYLMNRVISVRAAAECFVCDNYTLLELPCQKLQWEADSPMAWAKQQSEPTTLLTFGDLIEVCKHSGGDHTARQLDRWYAGTDDLGLLMRLAVAMI